MLQLVLGRAGCGKTEYVFSSIKKLVENGEKNLLLITPEQFSFISEKRLLKDLGESGIREVESTSFTRLGVSVFSKYGSEKLPVLSKGSKAVLMKKAIESVSDSLKLFSNLNSVSFINSAVQIYDEMKSCRVTVEAIEEASADTDNKILSAKLHDIGLIISMYDALIKDRYLDPASELTRLYEKLLTLDYFKGRTVFIDGFSGFAAQEYKILEVILKQADKVYITFCTDTDKSRDKYDLFYYVNRNIGILFDVIEKAGVRREEAVILDKTYRFNNKYISYLERGFYTPIKDKYTDVPENITVYRAKNVYDECDNVSRKITELLKEGYRASDIAVIVRDLEKYEKELGASFKKFGVPYFDDERQSISSEPLIMLVRFLLRTVIYSYRSSDIFSLLKTGLTSLSDDEISELENYVFLWNINGSKWKSEFTESTKGFTDTITENDKRRLEGINKSRKYVVDIISKFRKRCKNSTLSNISRALYYALSDFEADKNLKALAISLDKDGKSALADEQGRIWALLMDIISELDKLSTDEKITLREFSKLFNLMINSLDLGVIPVGLDNVQLGSADRMRCNNPRAVFILGADEGEFPKAVVSAGLLTESDRVALIDNDFNNDFKLYSYGDTLNAQEKYFAYMAVSAARERLYVSYTYNPALDNESSIVREIEAVFPNVKYEMGSTDLSLDLLESNANAFELLADNYDEKGELIASLKEYFRGEAEYSERLGAIDKTVENADIELKSGDTAVSLFGRDMFLSATRISDYYNCSFRYFCKYGLSARPRKKAELDPMQTGTVIHYVLEQIIKEKGKDGLCALSDGEVRLLVNEHLEYYLKNKMGDSSQFTPRFRYQFMRLSKMLVSVVKRLRSEFSVSDFEPKAFELRITAGNDTDADSVKSKVLTLPDGGKIEIVGAIDRVDMYEENGEKYVRVVDYKSGTKDFKLSDILYGLNLQMFIYLFTLSEGDSKYSGKAAGVLYMHSARRLLAVSRGADIDKQVASGENDLYKMKGIVLNDDENEIARHMERSLEGRFIPAKANSKNVITGNIISLAELGMLSRRIDLLISDMGIALHGGIINPNPVHSASHDKTCEFCDYKSVCMNRCEITPREINDLKNDEVMQELRKGDE